MAKTIVWAVAGHPIGEWYCSYCGRITLHEGVCSNNCLVWRCAGCYRYADSFNTDTKGGDIVCPYTLSI